MGWLTDWIFNRALRISHRTTVALAKKLHVDPAKIEVLNDAGAAAVANAAGTAADKLAGGGKL